MLYDKSMENSMQSQHYDKIAQAIHYINSQLHNQPELHDIADAVNLSPYHFQRVFREWAGISPKRFLQFLTVKHAKQLLTHSSTLDVSLQTGLSSQSRLHDHFVSLEAVTPGQYKQAGLGVDIQYGFAPSPFGTVFMATTDLGICHLAFVDDKDQQTAINELSAHWPNARLNINESHIKQLAVKIFKGHSNKREKFHLLVQGSNFQIKVWESLLRIPEGQIQSYQHIASAIAQPKASRAVANAIAKNPVAYLIPCHRVIRSTGVISGYRWGTERKQALIAWESAKRLEAKGESQ